MYFGNLTFGHVAEGSGAVIKRLFILTMTSRTETREPDRARRLARLLRFSGNYAFVVTCKKALTFRLA